ncbi:MAG: bifunctional DNA-formamidopyrimidine glycosylase/DNA-(apurinic or apyrimidinic site) lyase, partial [Zetaproteobacteria bacterium]
ALARSRAPIKAKLMDQRVLAGLGNIYANEACFRARIHPARRAHTLDEAAIKALAKAIQAVLAEAIEAGGSTIRDFVSAEGRPGYFAHRFAVYGRAGLPCPVCQTPIARMRTGGRSTFLCPRCQR